MLDEVTPGADRWVVAQPQQPAATATATAQQQRRCLSVWGSAGTLIRDDVMANDAGQWRAVDDLRYGAETLSARPLHQPGWALQSSRGSFGHETGPYSLMEAETYNRDAA